MKRKVTTLPNNNKYRFGGSEVLPAFRKGTFPGRLANQTHIVNSDIPMLWSRQGMMRAGVVLDMSQNGPWIRGAYLFENYSFCRIRILVNLVSAGIRFYPKSEI